MIIFEDKLISRMFAVSWSLKMPIESHIYKRDSVS